MKQQKILLVAHGLWNKNANKIQLKTGKKIPANWCEKTTRCELGCVPDTPVNIYMLKNPLHPHPPSAEDWCVPRSTAFGARVWNSSPLTLENQNDLPKNQNKPQKSPKNQCDELRAFGGAQGRGYEHTFYAISPSSNHSGCARRIPHALTDDIHPTNTKTNSKSTWKHGLFHGARSRDLSPWPNLRRPSLCRCAGAHRIQEWMPPRRGIWVCRCWMWEEREKP